MRALRFMVPLFVCLVSTGLSAAPRVFVASTGIDTSVCTRTAPCRSFAYAIQQTSSGGEIVALDTGGFGPVTIPFSVSIYAAPGQVASITAAGVNGVTITAGVGDTVNIRNLFIASDLTQYGVRFDGGAALTVEDTTFTHVNGGVSVVRPSGTDNVQVAIHNCRFLQSGSGIYAQSTSGSIYLNVKNCQFDSNATGAAFAEHAFAAVTDSTFAGNTHAVDAAPSVLSSIAPLSVDVERSTVTNNGTAFYAAGAAIVRAGHCIITDNGAAVAAFQSAQVLSRLEGSSLTNTLEANGGVSTFTGTFAGK